MLASAVLNPVRTTLNDETAPYHWSDAYLLAMLGRVIVTLLRDCPEAAMDFTAWTLTPTAPTATTDDIGLSATWLQPLVDGVLAEAFRIDAEDRGNAARADAHLKLRTAGVV